MLETLIAREIAKDLPPELAAMAAAARARFTGARAILVYGSTLRGTDPFATLIDLYVLLERNGDAGANALSRMGQALLPPNVYAFDTPYDGRMLRAKAAVLTLDAFARAMTASRRNPYFWARFAQPVRLAFAAGEAERARVIAALAEAHRTLYGHGRSLRTEPLACFEQAFRNTYACELRSEGTDRAASLVAANRDYYLEAAAAMADAPALPAHWAIRRAQGKTLSILRLIKAGFTFAGGADYIVQKIERHSGERITLSPWQRRHPVLAGLIMLPRLLRRGAIK